MTGLSIYSKNKGIGFCINFKHHFFSWYRIKHPVSDKKELELIYFTHKMLNKTVQVLLKKYKD